MFDGMCIGTVFELEEHNVCCDWSHGCDRVDRPASELSCERRVARCCSGTGCSSPLWYRASRTKELGPYSPSSKHDDVSRERQCNFIMGNSTCATEATNQPESTRGPQTWLALSIDWKTELWAWQHQQARTCDVMERPSQQPYKLPLSLVSLVPPLSLTTICNSNPFVFISQTI